MTKKIRVGIIGVGNCFAGLIQGIEYYRKDKKKVPVGLMHLKVGPYDFKDIEFVSAFDVGRRQGNDNRQDLSNKCRRQY
ncbi:MAG: hypothetical protein AAB451_01640 [Patescibacteria group bacterium]